MKLTKEEKNYIAGFFDGEGCISLGKKKDNSYRRHHTYQLVVTAANTQKEVLDFLHSKFGGHFRKQRNYSNPNGKEVWVWASLCRKALEFLREIYPFLRLKRKQCELAFEYYKLVNPYGNHKFNLENWKKRDEIYFKLKDLNHRGKNDFIQLRNGVSILK